MLKALDERYVDFNKVPNAERAYNNLEMHKDQTFREFRSLFSKYATEGKIPADRWFYNMCKKVNPRL